MSSRPNLDPYTGPTAESFIRQWANLGTPLASAASRVHRATAESFESIPQQDRAALLEYADDFRDCMVTAWSGPWHLIDSLVLLAIQVHDDFFARAAWLVLSRTGGLRTLVETWTREMGGLDCDVDDHVQVRAVPVCTCRAVELAFRRIDDAVSQDELSPRSVAESLKAALPRVLGIDEDLTLGLPV